MFKENLEKFINKATEKEGFYVILFVCICIVATTAVWVSKENVNKIEAIEKKEDNTLVENNYGDYNAGDYEYREYFGEDEEDTSITVIEIDESNQEKEQNQESVQVVNTQQESQQTQQEVVAEEKETEPEVVQTLAQTVETMAMPLKGKISLNYAEDKLVYSKTLEQWMTHKGLDITAKQGTVVRAALDGIVSKIEKETDLGIIITINHSNKVTTKYACVSTDEMVEIGQTINKGDPISGVGKGVGFELAQGPHLHFEVIVNGKNVNPTLYLPKFN